MGQPGAVAEHESGEPLGVEPQAGIEPLRVAEGERQMERAGGVAEVAQRGRRVRIARQVEVRAEAGARPQPRKRQRRIAHERIQRPLGLDADVTAQQSTPLLFGQATHRRRVTIVPKVALRLQVGPHLKCGHGLQIERRGVPPGAAERMQRREQRIGGPGDRHEIGQPFRVGADQAAVETDAGGRDPDPRHAHGRRGEVVVGVHDEIAVRGVRQTRRRGAVDVRGRERERVQQQPPGRAGRLSDPPQQQRVARRRGGRRPQSRQRVGPQVGPGEVERRARRRGVADGEGHRESPAVGEQSLQADGAAQTQGVVRDVRRILAELAELGVPAGDAQRQVSEIGRRHRQVHGARHAGVVHHVAQSNVVDP